MAIQRSSSVLFDGLSPQAATEILRFPASSFGKFLEQAREAAGVTRDPFIEILNEILTTRNARLPSKNQIALFNTRIYGNLERNRRYPAFEELEPLYQALSELLSEPFSRREREHYLALAQARFAARERPTKKGYTPTRQDWLNLLTKLAALETHNAAGHATQQGKVPYLLPVSSTDSTPIRLSAKVLSLLNYDTSHIIERERYVEEVIKKWDEGKRLLITKAISGTGKTRAFYLLLKRVARMQNRWPFYYALSPSTQTPDDHLDSLLSLFSTDLQLSSPEERPLSREERMEQIFAELARCSEQGLRLAVLVDDAHLLLDPSGRLSASWQHFFDQWIAREHTAVLCLAAREWPRWKGRDRSFLKELDLKALSAKGGATIWKRFGFDDVSDTLLEQASQKCGGYPQWIELRASDLDQPGHQFLWPRSSNKVTYTSQSADNKHTKRIKAWLEEETIFDTFTTSDTREELAQIFTRELPHEAQQVLDLLVLAPLGLPLPLLQKEFEHPELAVVALDELKHRSLMDRDSMEQGRATLVSLVREARLYQLSQEQREYIEQKVTALYTSWLYNLQQYQDDHEQAALISELVILYSKKHLHLKANELLVTFGWLCAQLGHINRIERHIKTNPSTLVTVSTPEVESGRQLLYYQVTSLTGQRVDAQERYMTYQHIHAQALDGEFTLPPHTEVMLTHFLAAPLLRTEHFIEAQELFELTMQRISQQTLSPEVYAAFLHSKTNLFETWSKSKNVGLDTKRVLSLQEQCVATLTEAADCWRAGLRNTLPLQETYIKFKLARVLNDLALNLRLLGRIPEAEQAIIECIALKQEKKGGATSQSYAISLGEHAQILAACGKLEESHELNMQAQMVINRHIEEGNSRARGNKGMLLVEQASVYIQQARLREAKSCLEEAQLLLEGTTSRQEYLDQAADLLRQIDSWLHPSIHYQLDRRWFERYHQLANYDDLEMLAQAGTFTIDEQREWDTLLPRRSEDGIKAKLKEIIADSKERALAKCLAEEPHNLDLTYPLIEGEINDIVSRIAGFRALQAEIETQESHAIVRRLYVDRIKEHLHGLLLLEAVYAQKTEQVRAHNEWLYGRPTIDEASIALGEFAKMLQRASKHPEACFAGEKVRAQLRQWHISIEDFIKKEEAPPRKKNPLVRKPELTRKGISASALQGVLEEILGEYHFTNWQVVPSPERENFAIDPDLATIALPSRKSYSPLQALELIAEEIETHVFRSESGKRSPLALLGSGTRGYLVLDEGLAVHYIRQVRISQGLEEKVYSHVNALALCMVTGILFPALNFRDLFTFLRQAFSISHLLAERCTTYIEAEKEAEHDTLRLLTRTYRGVRNMASAVETCNLKDRLYLQGEIEIAKKRETMPIERMLVGAVGGAQLQDMAELGLLKPAIPHLQLARNPEVLAQLVRLACGKEQ